MKDMKVGDQAFLYHSNCKIPGIAGIMEISKEAYPDCTISFYYPPTMKGFWGADLDTATDPSHPYYDEKAAKKEEPTWFMVDVKFVRRLGRLIPLKELQEYKETELKDMVVVGKTRLSVQPVRENEWEFILTLEDKAPEEDA
jgi:predicted RNA-binding protein with PUA-like domain